MGMEVPNSDQSPAHIEHRDESDLKILRERVKQGTAQADAGHVIPAHEVFNELRQRNVEAAKRPG